MAAREKTQVNVGNVSATPPALGRQSQYSHWAFWAGDLDVEVVMAADG